MKKKINKIIIITMIVTMSIFLFGCTSKTHESEGGVDLKEKVVEEVTLNERQKELLRELGLPEEYDELNASQKDGIVMIEKALVYLEDKYPQKFEYDGYVAGGYDGQYVTVKVVDSCPEEYVNVQIYKEDGQYELADDYENILCGKEATVEMKEFLSEYFEPADIQVYMDVYEVQDGDTAVERALGAPNVMINGVYTEEKIEKVAKAYIEWIETEHNRKGACVRFRMYSVEEYSSINEFNYTDFFGNEILQLKVTFDESEPMNIKRY